MDQVAIPAVFMRGGTSKAVVFDRRHLPADRDEWAAIFQAALGSPDPYGRQLDGMGGGLSSLSKICVAEPSRRADADIDYTFAQVEIGADRVDFSANCGSMSAAIGPFALDQGIIARVPDGRTSTRIHNTNTGKIIVAHFDVRGGSAAVDGDFTLDGVAGTGAPIRLDFLSPGGAATGRLLPTGNVIDKVSVPDVGDIEYSFVDAGNPCMFIAASSVGQQGTELPAEISAAAGLLARLESIRRHVGVASGIAPDLEAAGRIAAPRIALVAPMREAPTLSGRRLGRSDADILVRMIGRGLPNPAVPITTALPLAVACRLPGSVPQRLLAGSAPQGTDIRVAHPSGVWTVGADVAGDRGSYEARSASVTLTARRLFQGEVLVPRSRLAGSRPRQLDAA